MWWDFSGFIPLSPSLVVWSLSPEAIPHKFFNKLSASFLSPHPYHHPYNNPPTTFEVPQRLLQHHHHAIFFFHHYPILPITTVTVTHNFNHFWINFFLHTTVRNNNNLFIITKGSFKVPKDFVEPSVVWPWHNAPTKVTSPLVQTLNPLPSCTCPQKVNKA
jgi:hypothetical protein